MFAAKNTAAPSGEAVYIESVFSTYLYTGTGATQTITNGIDLTGKGGLVWLKKRSSATGGSHRLMDTVRGGNKLLSSNTTGAESTSNQVTFLSSGFNVIDAVDNAATYVSWTFRKQAKFFDVVTYTGNGSSTRDIAHNLGSVPGCIIIKRTDASDDWRVYHRGWGFPGEGGALNLTAGFSSTYKALENVDPTATTFRPATPQTNTNGATYVAYLFAHNAGGFGASGTDNVISCGSFTGTNRVNLGYEPQWFIMKRTDSTSPWYIMDNMRGLSAIYSDSTLSANAPDAETVFGLGAIDATGITLSVSGTWIYIAIRRGPMKTPTSGTSVFSPVARTGTSAAATISGVGFAPDFAAIKARSTNSNNTWLDKLRGAVRLQSDTTNPEDNYLSGITSWNNDGISLGAAGHVNGSPETFINYLFRRAPGFFDVVCYTGTGSATTFNHNLTVVPELMIVKSRNNATNWAVYCAYLGGANPANRYVLLNSSQSLGGTAVYWNDTAPTSTVFTVGTTAATNTSSYTYVNYLFATVVGVSKVGSYTGTGTTKQIDCGFTAGARFVMIKRTDSTGDWYVWDTARGIVSGNDPYLLLNSTAAEVTSTDYIDPLNAGFEISSAAPADINANGGTFIFLAIA